MREGGYDDLAAAEVEVAMEALTGRAAHTTSDPAPAATAAAPGDPLRDDSADALVTRIAGHLAARRAVVLSIRGSFPARLRAEARSLDLVDNHAYAVVRVGADGVTLHNPWGERHPHGTLTGAQIKRLFTALVFGDSLTGPNASPPTLPPATAAFR